MGTMALIFAGKPRVTQRFRLLPLTSHAFHLPHPKVSVLLLVQSHARRGLRLDPLSSFRGLGATHLWV